MNILHIFRSFFKSHSMKQYTDLKCSFTLVLMINFTE